MEIDRASSSEPGVPAAGLVQNLPCCAAVHVTATWERGKAEGFYTGTGGVQAQEHEPSNRSFGRSPTLRHRNTIYRSTPGILHANRCRATVIYGRLVPKWDSK